MTLPRSLDAVRAAFYDGLGLPRWQQDALLDPRMNQEVVAMLLLTEAVTRLQEAVLALALPDLSDERKG